jgi:muramidase (phage lysozyme)
MDNTVPAGAKRLLDFIGDIEAPKGYNTIFGNNQNKLPKPVTKMTLAEIQAAQPSWTKRFGSSATGRYQFMRNTLRELMTELKLDPSEKLDADLQDRLAYHLLRRRGYDAFMFGRIDMNEFGKRLAQEWASLPVLVAVKGAHQQLRRGQSFYAGDALNKSLVAPISVERVLGEAKALHDAKPGAPRVRKPNTGRVATTAAVAGGTAVAVAVEAPALLSSFSAVTDTIQPVTEALTSIAAVPATVLIVSASVAAGAALVWWIYKRYVNPDEKPE